MNKIVFSVFLIFRIAALFEIALEMMGILWFSGYYFSLAHFGQTTVALIPLTGLIIGVFATNKVLAASKGFWLSLLGLLLSAGFLLLEMYKDFTLVNGPDFYAFESRAISLVFIFVFVLRVLFCKRVANQSSHK